MPIDLEAYKLNVRLAEEDLEGAIPSEQHTISMCKRLIAEVERLNALIADHDGPGLARECYKLADPLPGPADSATL